MKCSNCGFENLEGSTFCQECGNSLEKKNKEQKEEKHSVYREIEDVIFTPKKKNSSVAVVVVLAVLVIGAIIFVYVNNFASSNNQSSQNSLDNALETNKQSTTSNETEFPLSQLSISNPSMEWVGYSAYFKGTLKNSYNKPATLIKIRLDFSYDQNMKDVFDTRYVYVQGVAANGAYTFDLLVSGFTTDKKFWYLAKIEGASF